MTKFLCFPKLCSGLPKFKILGGGPWPGRPMGKCVTVSKHRLMQIHISFYKKLVYRNLVLRRPKFQETLVLCLRSIKKLLKVWIS